MNQLEERTNVLARRPHAAPSTSNARAIYSSLRMMVDRMSKQPAGPPALAALRRSLVSVGLARWTFRPIRIADRALGRSLASLPVNHAPALPIG